MAYNYSEYKDNCVWLGMNEMTYEPLHTGKNNQISSVPNQCFGHKYLRNWIFKGNAEFLMLDVMDTVKRQAFYADQFGMPMVAPKKFMTVGTYKDGREIPLGMVSDRYAEIKDTELLNIVNEAIKDTNLEIGGSYISEGGHTNFVVFFKNPEYRFDQGLGTGREDNSLIAMVISNDHLGKASCKMTAIGIREICWNFQLWGDIIGSKSIRHMKIEDDIETATRFMMDTLLDTGPLKDAIHYIRNTPVVTADMPYIFAGIGLDSINIDTIMTYYQGLNREMDVDNISLYDVYNIGTAYNTYRSGLSANGALTEGKKIEKILTENYDSLYDEGMKRIESMKEKAKEKGKEIRFLELLV